MNYIDELIEVAINQDPQDISEEFCERKFYAVHNAQYNVLGLVQPTTTSDPGNVVGQRLVERYEYTPYGQREVYSHGWILQDVNGDGVVDSGDLGVFDFEQNGANAPDSLSDMNGDGSVEGPDEGIITSAYGTSVPQNDPLVLTRTHSTARGATGNSLATPLNTLGHQGLAHDEETGLVYNRARYLLPSLERFAQRDTLGYIDGMNTHAYYAAQYSLFDPSGNELTDNEIFAAVKNVALMMPLRMRARSGRVNIAGKSFLRWYNKGGDYMLSQREMAFVVNNPAVQYAQSSADTLLSQHVWSDVGPNNNMGPGDAGMVDFVTPNLWGDFYWASPSSPLDMSDNAELFYAFGSIQDHYIKYSGEITCVRADKARYPNTTGAQFMFVFNGEKITRIRDHYWFNTNFGGNQAVAIPGSQLQDRHYARLQSSGRAKAFFNRGQYVEEVELPLFQESLENNIVFQPTIHPMGDGKLFDAPENAKFN